MSESPKESAPQRRVLTNLQIATAYTNLGVAGAYLAGAYILAKNILRSLTAFDLNALVLILHGLVFIGLGYGVRKHSRICATLLIVYWLSGKWELWPRPYPLGTRVVVFSVVGAFAIAFVAGLVGTIKYHRLKKQGKIPEQPVGPAN